MLKLYFYKQNPLEKLFIFTINQNYALALSLETFYNLLSCASWV